jgi:hypothetical protein
MLQWLSWILLALGRVTNFHMITLVLCCWHVHAEPVSFQSKPSLFSLQNHHQTHYPQHDLLQPWVLAQQDGDVSNKGNEADHAANHVLLAVEERLALGVELGIVCEVVVTLGEKTEGRLTTILSALTISYSIALLRAFHSTLDTENVHLLSAVPPHYPVHDRDILALDIVDHDLANLGIQPPVPQEQQVSPLERRLHGPRQHNNNRRRRVADYGKPLPEHEGCR